jgi:hypothetical protein
MVLACVAAGASQAWALISTSSWRLGRPLLAKGTQAGPASKAALMMAWWSSSTPSLALSGQVDGTGRVYNTCDGLCRDVPRGTFKTMWVLVQQQLPFLKTFCGGLANG